MPNHWHLMLWSKQDGELSTCLRWLSVTHTNRRHAACGTIGSGHLYQGRFKSFVVQGDQHLWTVCRYVERNALRAGLVQRAEDWRWSSAHQMAQGHPDGIVAEWPIARPNSWLSWQMESGTFFFDSAHRSRACPLYGSTYLQNNSKISVRAGRRLQTSGFLVFNWVKREKSLSAV